MIFEREKIPGDSSSIQKNITKLTGLVGTAAFVVLMKISSPEASANILENTSKIEQKEDVVKRMTSLLYEQIKEYQIELSYGEGGEIEINDKENFLEYFENFDSKEFPYLYIGGAEIESKEILLELLIKKDFIGIKKYIEESIKRNINRIKTIKENKKDNKKIYSYLDSLNGSDLGFNDIKLYITEYNNRFIIEKVGGGGTYFTIPQYDGLDLENRENLKYCDPNKTKEENNQQIIDLIKRLK